MADEKPKTKASSLLFKGGDKKEPAAEPEKKAEPAAEAAPDPHAQMQDRHSKAWEAMHKAHRDQHRDLHGSHRTQRDDLAKQHEDQRKMLAQQHMQEMAQGQQASANPAATPAAGVA